MSRYTINMMNTVSAQSVHVDPIYAGLTLSYPDMEI